MKVLFIGGTGIINTACTRLATEQGIDLTLFNRDAAPVDVPCEVNTLTADIEDTAELPERASFRCCASPKNCTYDIKRLPVATITHRSALEQFPALRPRRHMRRPQSTERFRIHGESCKWRAAPACSSKPSRRRGE